MFRLPSAWTGIERVGADDYRSFDSHLLVGLPQNCTFLHIPFPDSEKVLRIVAVLQKLRDDFPSSQMLSMFVEL
jgi:hypothetical protein